MYHLSITSSNIQAILQLLVDAKILAPSPIVPFTQFSFRCKQYTELRVKQLLLQNIGSASYPYTSYDIVTC